MIFCKKARSHRFAISIVALAFLFVEQVFVGVNLAADQPQTSQAQSLSETATGDTAASEILEKNLKAIGGRDRFASIKFMEVQIERSVLGRTIKVKRIVDVVGNRSLQRQDTNGAIIETGFDGKRAWQKAPFFRGYLEASTPQAKAIMRGGISLPGANLYDYKSGGKKFARLPDEQIDGKIYTVVKSGYADEAGKETPVKYYFDPATYLIKQIVTGNAVSQTETFDDYRKVEGITVAFASTITNPQITLTSKITGLKFNTPIDASVFEFRAPTGPTSAAGTTAASRATESSRATSDNELSESIRIETFERVWKIVNDTFYDTAFNGVNWRAVHDRYLPSAKTTLKGDDFHKLLNRMVQELHLSHFKVSAAANVLTLSSSAERLNNGATGLSFQWIENQLVVSNVKKDSSAEAAGIRPGFVLKRVNGKTPEQLYAEYQKENEGYRLREELARARAVSGELAGKADTKINLELAGADGTPLKLEFQRKAQPAGRRLEFESKRLAGGIGYIKFSFFFGDLLTRFRTALREMKDTKALIIDLRGNPGGAGDLAPAMANLLCSVPGSLGSLKYRYETQQYSYQGSGEQAYKGKIVLLTDAGTGSTSEVFAGGLQANNRAVVIGSPSAGAVLPSLVELLPTGGALQYVVADFQTPNGTALEGRGVTPDVLVHPSRTDFITGRDATLERAADYMRKQEASSLDDNRSPNK